ncbi:hypothetical protein [Natrinema salsiterrestre]|uniref:Uncharacterized protein n=1 Tax=Natrinema salsiterrestre TaxID=2950540 RepID=A0A9Q4L163_9EURY|nr:hypothetical protein [Natrinema salsiterrestre]MDF9748150.1 hypothetical protein [Natrinema salsiterrestre]
MANEFECPEDSCTSTNWENDETAASRQSKISDFGSLEHPEDRTVQLMLITGAQDHRLFVKTVDELYIGTDDGVEQQQF